LPGETKLTRAIEVTLKNDTFLRIFTLAPLFQWHVLQHLLNMLATTWPTAYRQPLSYWRTKVFQHNLSVELCKSTFYCSTTSTLLSWVLKYSTDTGSSTVNYTVSKTNGYLVHSSCSTITFWNESKLWQKCQSLPTRF